ncbi:MAG TPA: ATP-binding protein [Puia sp.]|nr:ATP-binding protein [Puia sp.]
MRMAVDIMKQSISETRTDGKSCPKVGAILVSPDEKNIVTAFRGELREGDHAEFTLLERKNRDKDLTGYYLFATLEPCAPCARRHPKLGCAERIVHARIAKVWIGIEDPDPTVDRKGVRYLQQSNIEVEMFDEEYQDEIRHENKEFLAHAIVRAAEAKSPKEVILSPLEQQAPNVEIGELSQEALELYINRAKLPYEYNSREFCRFLLQQELLVHDKQSDHFTPTGLALLLFGKNPRLTYPQAVVKAEVRHKNAEPRIKDFNESLVFLPEKIEEWIQEVIPSTISREQFARTENYEYPVSVLREAVINAIVHRDYDIQQAKIYLIIEEDKIIVRSPGEPVKPIKWDDFKNFKAPSLSRNPKIMSIFNQMTFVEERGIGMREMKLLPSKYQLPLPIITRNEPYLDILFPRKENFIREIIGEDTHAELNDEEEKGLLYLHNKDFVSKKEYADHFKFDDKKAQRHLSKFKNLGLVLTKGNARSVKYKMADKSA